MRLLELLVQGVAGFPQQGRLAFAQGHVVVRVGAPLLPVLRSLLFYDGNPEDGASRLAAAPVARAALVLQGRDGGTWRLVRDLRGACSLQRLEVGRFAPVGAGPAEIGPLLRAQVGVPARPIFEELLTFDPARVGGDPVAPDAPAPSPAAPAPAPIDAAELRRRVAALEQELAASRRMDGVQRRLDELLHEQAAVQRDRDAVAAAEARASGLRGELRRFEGIADLPDDVGPLLEGFRTADEERSAAHRRLEEDRRVVERRAPGETPAPVWKDRRFLAACGVGIAALGVGVLTPLRIVALLNVPAFGVAAGLGVKWIGALQALESADRMGALFAERERKIEAQWEARTQPVREALARAGVQLPEELEELVRARAEARTRLAAAEEELRAVESRHGGAAARLEALRRESGAIEDELTSLAAAAYRPRTAIEAELAGARAQLEGRAPETSMLLGSAVPLGAPKAAPAAGAAAPDPCARLLEHAAELLAVDRHEIGGRVAERVGQYLAALSDRRLTEVALSSVAGMRCGGVPFSGLPLEDRALALLALQLALIEQVSAGQPLPVLYDDAFAFLDERRQQLLGRMLRGLGQRTQVIHRTEARAFLGAADAVAEVA